MLFFVVVIGAAVAALAVGMLALTAHTGSTAFWCATLAAAALVASGPATAIVVFDARTRRREHAPIAAPTPVVADGDASGPGEQAPQPQPTAEPAPSGNKSQVHEQHRPPP